MILLLGPSVQDLLLYAELRLISLFLVAPRLLDSLKILKHATTPKTISVTIQQTCRMLSRMTQSLCKGFNVDPREGDGPVQLDKDVCLVPHTYCPRIVKSLPLVLLDVTTEVLAALVKLPSPQMPFDKINSKLHSTNTSDEDTASASKALMLSLASILSSIHINSINIMQNVAKQANAPMATSKESLTFSAQDTSAGKGMASYRARFPHSYIVPDLRKGITSYFVQLIGSLREDIQQHRDLTEAMAFSLMTLFGSQTVRCNVAQDLRKSRKIGSGDRKDRGKQPHWKGRADMMGEEELLYISDLAGEESSWFWVEILDVLWRKYLKNFEYMGTSANQPPQACSGTPDGARNINDLCFTNIEPRKSMVTEAKRKLKEALLQDSLGEKGLGRNMRLINLPVLNEIWRMIGWDEEI